MIIWQILAISLSISFVSLKVFNKCDLARELKEDHGLSSNDVATYVCIAEQQSQLNTEAIGTDSYGIFQISSEFWCEIFSSGKACNLKCDALIDDDLNDDILCAKTIYNEHERIFGNGFTAWPSGILCQSISNTYMSNCSIESKNILSINEISIKKIEQEKSQRDVGKVYERCELALELRDIHRIPSEQIATWVCIAKHESNYNTSSIGRLNLDGSEDHGLFQISDIYWCSTNDNGYGKGCKLSCEDLRNNDIKDDIECILKIHREHTHLFGDGYQAWAVYPLYCKGKSEEFIRGCFDFENENEILPFQPRPGVVQNISVMENRYNNTFEEPATRTVTPDDEKNNTMNKQSIEYNSNADKKSLKKYPGLMMKIISDRTKIKKPSFDIFSFYLRDYTSKPTIRYKPVQFNKMRVVENITPHSIDYLLKLTTPKRN